MGLLILLLGMLGLYTLASKLGKEGDMGNG